MQMVPGSPCAYFWPINKEFASNFMNKLKTIEMKKTLFTMLIAVMGMTAFAQQDPMLSQYMFNHLLINPGYAGSKPYMMTSALYRNQWTGFEGAPITAVASIHGPWHGKNMGLGATIMNDHIGVTNRFEVKGDYSYHIPITEKVKVGVGLSAGLSYYTAKVSELVYWDLDDPIFQGDVHSNLLPNFGAGAFLYSKKYWAGISVPELISYDPDKVFSIDASADFAPRQVRHYFAEAGYVIGYNTDFAFRPSILVKYVKNTPMQADFNLNCVIKNVVWIGGSYRTNDAAVAIAEVQVNKKMRVGYSYDITLSELNNYSNGSHEIMIGYDFGYDIMKMKTPRYF